MSHEYESTVSQSGRVKAAGVPFDEMFAAGDAFAAQQSPQTAKDVADTFHQMRHAPSEELRDRIFPRSRATKQQFRSGALLTRPSLKTDQGAGQFLSFQTGENDDSPLHYAIDMQLGYSIEEPFFASQLSESGYPSEVMQTLHDVRVNFQSGDLKEAQLAYERLAIAAEQHGIEIERQAGVGRDALFFIRPSRPVDRIVVPFATHSRIVEMVRSQSSQFADLAAAERARFMCEHGIAADVARYNHPIYFQADVQVLPDGEIVLDQLQLPDVGLFLMTLDPMDNPAFVAVQADNTGLAHDVADAISQRARVGGKREVHLITRPEVLYKDEDVLEVREIAALRRLLHERGIQVHAVAVDDVSTLSPKDMALLLNVDVSAGSFDMLLAAHLRGETPAIFPDPFLVKARDRLTTYARATLSAEHIQSLRSLVDGISSKSSKAEDIFRATLATDAYLRRIGIHEDVFHLHIGSQHTPVACYRYDIAGLQIALGYIREKDMIEARNVPLSPDRAVLFQRERPVYSVFRFMVTEEAI